MSRISDSSDTCTGYLVATLAQQVKSLGVEILVVLMPSASTPSSDVLTALKKIATVVSTLRYKSAQRALSSAERSRPSTSLAKYDKGSVGNT